MLSELPAWLQTLLRRVGELAREQEVRCFAVGGFVRDLFLRRPNLDVDLLVEPDAMPLAQALAAELDAVIEAKADFGTASLALPDGRRIDLATARSESYERPGALPTVTPSSVTDDLRRRDFTVNAMALDLHADQFGELVDPFHGLADLRHRRLRVLHPLSFMEDPTRLFRAARFETRHNFRLTPHTAEMARAAVASSALGTISPERLRAEIYRTFAEPEALGALLRLEELGIWSHLHADLKLDQKLLAAAPAALQQIEQTGMDVKSELVMLASLLAPLQPEEAASAARLRLRIEGEPLHRLRAALDADPELLLDPALPASAITNRLEALPAEAIALLLARCGAAGLPEHRNRLHRYLDEWRHVTLHVTGRDLIELGFRRGPALGRALSTLRAARLDGAAVERQEQLDLARRLLEAAASSS